jgi:hypothetical protein
MMDRVHHDKYSEPKLEVGRATIVDEGPIRYVSEGSVTIVAKTPRGFFKLFKIIMHKEGSVYLPFPYMPGCQGYVSEVEPSSRTIDLRTDGARVDCDVKYSHHLSGQVHFKRLRKNDTAEEDVLPMRQSFRLDQSIGRMFELHIFHLQGFAPAEAERSGDKWLPILFDKHPAALCVTGEWWTKKGVVENIHGVSPVGPISQRIPRKGGPASRVLFVGPPPGASLQSHLLMLTSEEKPRPSGGRTATMVFRGGYDPHEGKAPDTNKQIMFMLFASRDSPEEATRRAHRNDVRRGARSRVQRRGWR